jgi:integrase
MLTSTPFAVSGVSMIDVPSSRSRDRRLQGDELARLLDAADDFTRDRIVAMLATGARGGELLALRWSDVVDGRVTLTTRKTKDRQPRKRSLPISVALAAIFDRRRIAPDGSKLSDDSFVFGDATGRRM